VLSNLYNVLCTVNTQHTSRQDAIIKIRLYLATILRYSKNSILVYYFYYTLILFLIGLKMAVYGRNM